MASVEHLEVTSDSRVRDRAAWLDLPVFSGAEARMRDQALSELTEHERTSLRHRERWLHRRRATDQLSIR